MATFLPGVTDTFPQQVLFQPDYNFLSMVQGTKQAQYDRSLSSIRNMYTSLFNAPLTNGENEEYRNRIHKQIQNQLKTLPGLDLSKSQNITAAQQVFDPLVNDQEVMKDMSETQSAQRELQISERFRLSEKAEERALYNPTSVQDINNNRMNLAEAKRGDGSIMQIQSRKYVPFFDSNKYLADLQKAEGLTMKTSFKDGQGYIIEMVNGKGAVQPFSQWAKARLANPQAQQYFGVLGRVNAENQIRGISQQTGMSKPEVREVLAEGIREGMISQKTEEGIAYQKQLREIDAAKAQYRKAYPDGKIPVSEKETFESILNAEEQYKGALEGVEQEILEMSSGEISHIASNLESIYARQAGDQAAGTWASTHALGTAQETIKTDDVVLKKWDLQQEYASMAQARELAIMNERGEQYRFDTRMKFDERMKLLDHAKDLELEQMKQLGGNPNGTPLGVSAIPQSGTPADSFQRTMDKTFDTAYNKAFSNDGALKGIVGDEKYSKMYRTIDKVKKIAQNQQVTLTDADLQTLIDLGTELDVQVVNPGNSTDARTMLNKLFSGTYKKLEERIAADPTQKAAANNEKLAGINGELFSAMSVITEQTAAINKTALAVSEYIAPNGVKRSGFENVPEISRINGRPVYDLSKLSEQQKAELSGIIPDEFKSMSGTYGKSYEFSKIQSGEILTIMSPNILNSIVVNNQNITTAYGKNEIDSLTQALTGVQGEELSKLYGQSITAVYDPAGENVIFNLKINPASGVAGKLDVFDNQLVDVKVSVPYATVASTPGLSRFAKNIGPNTAQYNKLGITQTLLDDFTSVAYLPSRFGKAGITGSISGKIDGDGSPIIVFEGTYDDRGVIKPIDQRFAVTDDLRKDLSAAERSIETLLQKTYNRTAEQQRSASSGTGAAAQEYFEHKW